MKTRILAVISIMAFCVICCLYVVASTPQLTACYWTGPSHRLHVISFVDGAICWRTIANWPNPESGWWQKGEVNVGPIIWTDTIEGGPMLRAVHFGWSGGTAHGIFRADGKTWYGLLNNDDGRQFGPEADYFELLFAVWPLLIVTGIPLAWIALRAVWRRHIRSAREALGCCGACGYDLRASPDRCPECGAPVSKR